MYLLDSINVNVSFEKLAINSIINIKVQNNFISSGMFFLDSLAWINSYKAITPNTSTPTLYKFPPINKIGISSMAATIALITLFFI